MRQIQQAGPGSQTLPASSRWKGKIERNARQLHILDRACAMRCMAMIPMKPHPDLQSRTHDRQNAAATARLEALRRQ